MFNDSGGDVILDNNTIGTGYSLTSSTNLRLCCRDMQFISESLIGKIYYVKITDNINNTLVRDYIPVKYDDLVGLFDRENNLLYLSSGTNEFIAGPEITE